MTLFDWLKEIQGQKRSWDEFTDAEKESFVPYMVNRFLSMYEPYIEIVNYVQKIPYTQKAAYYGLYCDLIPRNNNVWLKYVKSKVKGPNKDLLQTIAELFEISSREAKDWISILPKKEIKVILSTAGYQDDEVKKLLKK